MRGALLHYAASIGDSSQAFMSPSGSITYRRLRDARAAVVVDPGVMHEHTVRRMHSCDYSQLLLTAKRGAWRLRSP